MPLIQPQAADLGERLIAAGLINQGQFDLAQREQKRKALPLSKVLVELGFVTPDRLSDFLARATGARLVNVSQIHIDPAVANLIPREIARRFRAIPVSRVNGSLTVAMADPSNVIAIDAFSQSTGLQIDVVTGTERDILMALDRFDKNAGTIQEAIDAIIGERRRDDEAQAEAQAEKEEVVAGPEDEAPTIRLVGQIINRAVESGASDIHFEPDEKVMRIRIRVDGVLHPDVLIPKTLQPLVIARMKILADLDVSESRVPQDGRATVTAGRRQVSLRVSSLPTSHGESIVARILNPGSNLGRLKSLGLTPELEADFREVLEAPHGVVIVTGPTGSGKTTTLYAILNEISSPDYSIFTLEDPVEIRMSGIRQTQIKEEVGLTFSAGLRSLLRQDPDIILVGETRDTETAQLMIRAALTGHLVFSTLHTNDAPGAIPRLLDMGVEPFLLPDSLLAVLAQRLVRKLCPECKEQLSEADSAQMLTDLKIALPAGSPNRLWRSTGCAACNNSGYRGRQGIFELMKIHGAMHDAIVHRAGAHEFHRLAREGGLVSMYDYGIRLAVQGTTSLQELLRVTRGDH